ncbi:DUF255 domain-containing protein [Isosphaeraceae bacterium EP7]
MPAHPADQNPKPDAPDLLTPAGTPRRSISQGNLAQASGRLPLGWSGKTGTGPGATRMGLALLLALLLPAIARADDKPDAKKHPANHLAGETSPYLLLHAHNPVDWHPWGPEALAKAKAQGKPIFLSIGYSACYWCHVMERESFTDPAVAKLLNEHFVCIKVDREERPDVDQIYMSAVQILSDGGGGWPLSVFLTPNGLPFFGGTYFPPKPANGQPSFTQVVNGMREAFRDDRKQVDAAAEGLTQAVRKALAADAGRRVAPTRALAASGVPSLAETFDPDFGGFNYAPNAPRRPKFPEPTNLLYLVDQHRRTAPKGLPVGPDGKLARPKPEPNAPLPMVQTTLDQMARGGIRDHLAGGYHRYSTVRDWSVPHFEKMLYDNALIASALLATSEVDPDPRWQAEARSIFAFVARSLTSPEGAFYSSLDAETDGEEGSYYVWTRAEVDALLANPADSDLFALAYGLDGKSNFEGNRYVLREPASRAKLAAKLSLTPEALEARLAPLRSKLLAARDRRKAPPLDDKVLTSWNALMISAYADAHRLTGDPSYRLAAERAADFLLTKMRTPEGKLLRTSRGGQAKLAAYLEDYAFLAHALLKLHASTDDPKRLAQARDLTDRMIAEFSDPKDGGYFFTADTHESLLTRTKDPFDNALPSGNSVAIHALVNLAAATHESSYLDQADKALTAFGAILTRNPTGAPWMLAGMDAYLDARPATDTAAAATPIKPAQSVVQATATATPAEIAPGASLTVTVTLTHKPGWHTYANPSTTDTARPTTLTLAPGETATLTDVTYPTGQRLKSTPLGQPPVEVYEDQVTLTATLTLPPETPAGDRTIHLKLAYQPCNDRACLAPATLDLPVNVRIKAN